MDPGGGEFDPRPDLSGTWETHAVDNQAGFLDAFGSAFATGAPSVVNAKELHALAHDREAGVLEDTTMLGDTAVVNRTEIGRQREIVAPDGSVMKVTARWDGDVWVEVDEDLVLEVRRWREGDFLVVARTVTRDDGVLVTSKMFMGKPIRKAPVFAALPNVGSGKDSKVSSKKTKKTKKKTNAYVDEDATSETGSEHNSVYSHAQKAVESATAGVFGGLFGSKEGGSPKAGDPTAVSKKTGSKTSAVSARGAAKPKDAAAFFNLRLGTPFCGSFPCSLRNTPGHLYIFEFHVGFGALNLGDAAKWHAGAKTVNNLEIVGPTSLQLGLTTGLTLEFQGVDNRDAVYEALVSMLEKVPPSPGEEVHGEPDAKIAAPLRIGFEQERYVFVYVARCESLPDSANGSVAIATCALGRYGAAVTATGPTLQGAATRFSKTLAFPAAEADLAADSLILAIAGGGVGDSGFGCSTLGQALIPLAMLPRDRTGAEEVKQNPYAASLSPPGTADNQSANASAHAHAHANALAQRTYTRTPRSPKTSRTRSTRGELSVVAWIGTTSDLYELGNTATLAEPAWTDAQPGGVDAGSSGQTQAAVRVPPAVSRVTINVHKLRGVNATAGGLRALAEDAADAAAADSNAAEVRLKCSLRIGDQHSLTAAAAHTGAEQAQWGPSTRQFIAMEPRGGAMQVDVLLPDGKSIGRVDVDISSLPMRPAKGAYSRAHWLKLRAPPMLSDSASSGFGGRSGSRSGSSSRSKAGSKKSKGAMKQPNPACDPKTGVAGSGTEHSFFGGMFGAANATATVPARTVVETEPSSESDSDESDSEYDDASTMNGETDDDEYVGEILVDGFVDEGCGPTACIGRKTPLGELSLEILSMRGVTPEGQKTASPACLLECGGSWAHLPAASGRHPPAWRRKIISAVYDPAAACRIGVFDSNTTEHVPLGFLTIPVRRLPRGSVVVSTLALSGGPLGGADGFGNERAEITVRVKYTPRVSTAASLFAYFAPPLPVSAYVFGWEQGVGGSGGVEAGIDALVTQQREYTLASLTEGPAALPKGMVSAMLPAVSVAVSRAEKNAALKSARCVKACVVRIAASLDPFAKDIDFIVKAVTWSSPLRAGVLHVLIMLFVYHPATILPFLALVSATRAATHRRPGYWTLLGLDKSHNSGSFDVGDAPPGSKLAHAETVCLLGPDAPSELASADHAVFGERDRDAKVSGVSAAARALGVNPRVETYEFLVQFMFWVQTLARHFVWYFEHLFGLMTWRDAAKSHAFAVACFASAFVMLFVKLRFIVVVLCFVALRHPIAGKPQTAPYRLALAAEP